MSVSRRTLPLSISLSISRKKNSAENKNVRFKNANKNKGGKAVAGTRELVEGRKRLADGGLRDIRSHSRIHRIPFLLCFPPRGRVTRTRPRVPIR